MRNCEELCSLISAKYDELHDECAGPYYQYATALLEVARSENQLLATTKLNQGPEGEGEEGPDSTEKTGSSLHIDFEKSYVCSYTCNLILMKP